MTARGLSAAERAVVARFDAAEPAPESCVERVARALFIADAGHSDAWPPGYADGDYRRMAHAAIDAMRVPFEATDVRRCESGCGCRYGTEDPDRLDCGCDGPCTTADDDTWGTP